MAASVFRATDLPARYGGEEFVVLMPNTNQKGAQAVAERVGERIRTLALPHAHSDVAAHVTVSIGVSSALPCTEQAASSLVAMADTALYSAKHAGRDRVVLFEPATAPTTAESTASER